MAVARDYSFTHNGGRQALRADCHWVERLYVVAGFVGENQPIGLIISKSGVPGSTQDPDGLEV